MQGPEEFGPAAVASQDVGAIVFGLEAENPHLATVGDEFGLDIEAMLDVSFDVELPGPDVLASKDDRSANDVLDEYVSRVLDRRTIGPAKQMPKDNRAAASVFVRDSTAL